VSIPSRNLKRYEYIGDMEKHIKERAVLDFYDRIPFWYNELKKIPLSDSIIEIGCSHGGFLKYCRDRGFQQCIGIELTEGVCEFARNTFGVEMICADFPNVEVTEKAGIVCAFDVLEHVENPLPALRKMVELGKYVMVQIPFYSGENLKDFPYFDAGVHLYLPSEKAIDKLFKIAGLEITSKVQGAFIKNLTITGRVKNEGIN